jgi:hypothetical protein
MARELNGIIGPIMEGPPGALNSPFHQTSSNKQCPIWLLDSKAGRGEKNALYEACFIHS